MPDEVGLTFYLGGPAGEGRWSKSSPRYHLFGKLMSDLYTVFSFPSRPDKKPALE